MRLQAYIEGLFGALVFAINQNSPWLARRRAISPLVTVILIIIVIAVGAVIIYLLIVSSGQTTTTYPP